MSTTESDVSGLETLTPTTVNAFADKINELRARFDLPPVET